MKKVYYFLILFLRDFDFYIEFYNLKILTLTFFCLREIRKWGKRGMLGVPR